MPRYTDPETGKSFSSETPLNESELEEAFGVVSGTTTKAPSASKPGWVEPAKAGLETAGVFGGALAGGVPGAALGYAGAKAVGRLGEELLGYEQPTSPLETGIRTAKDIAVGGAMEAGGQVVGRGLQVAAEHLAPLARRLYGSAIKTPLSKKWVSQLPGEEVSRRTRAIDVGIQEKVPPSEYGLEMVKKLERETSSLVDSITEEGAKRGNSIVTKDLIDKGFKRAREIANNSSDPVGAHKILDRYEAKFLAHGNEIDVKTLNEIKRQLYNEVAWQSAQKTGLSPQLQEAYKKGLAHEAMTFLENKYPALDKLNAKDGALIDLREALERSLGRLDNKDIIGLGTKVLTRKETWPLAVINATIGHQQVKSRLAFALSKASALGGMPTTGRFISYGLTPRIEE